MGEQAAIDAGARALWAHRNRNAREPASPAPDHIDRMMAMVVLEAAQPHIAAAERERIIALAEHHRIRVDMGALAPSVPFADLLREQPPTTEGDP